MKKTIARCFTVAIIPVLAIFLTCGKGNNNPTGPSGTKVNDYTLAYTVSGDSLFVTQSQFVSSGKGCYGDSMVYYSDTSQEYNSITVYELIGNTLKLLSSTLDTMSTSGAVVMYYSELSRVGTGTGITGVWKYTGESYRVVSGTLQSADLQYLNGIVSTENSMMLSMTAEYQFTGSQINIYMSGTPDYASEFISYDWNGDAYYSDSALYNVTVKKVGKDKVTLTGNVTHEVVTIQWIVSDASNYAQMQYTETFTSSNAAHAAYSYYSNPQTCPNDYFPAWWQNFLDANPKVGLLKPLAKKRAYEPRNIRNPLFPRSLLFVK